MFCLALCVWFGKSFSPLFPPPCSSLPPRETPTKDSSTLTPLLIEDPIVRFADSSDVRAPTFGETPVRRIRARTDGAK